MMRDTGGQHRMMHALSWRLALGLVLLIVLVIGYTMGWISPHPLGA